MTTTTQWCYASENEARQSLIDCCRGFAGLGLNQGKSGNASLRWHRGAREGMLITPSGLAYEVTGVDDIAWVALVQPEPSSVESGAVLGAPAHYDGPRTPSSEWRMHRDIFLARPEAQAIVHVHSPFATSLACTPRIQREGITAFHYMVAVAGGADIRCAPYATFGTQALSEAALVALRGRRACLLANHGQIAWGTDLDRALALAREVETLSQHYWQALQLGEPARLDQDEMARVLAAFDRYGR